ncbi:MAG TPA: hypothetical protein VMS73_03400 [Anaerolineaceae bacterium]|nr:hypothetical protein [Anaerolineaceae bacterium]
MDHGLHPASPVLSNQYFGSLWSPRSGLVIRKIDRLGSSQAFRIGSINDQEASTWSLIVPFIIMGFPSPGKLINPVSQVLPELVQRHKLAVQSYQCE